MIEKIYADSEYKFVKAVMLYAKTDDGENTLYFDDAHTMPVNGEQLVAAFINGCIIGDRFKPVAIDAGSAGGYVVTCVQSSGSSSASVTQFYSADYSSNE